MRGTDRFVRRAFAGVAVVLIALVAQTGVAQAGYWVTYLYGNVPSTTFQYGTTSYISSSTASSKPLQVDNQVQRITVTARVGAASATGINNITVLAPAQTGKPSCRWTQSSNDVQVFGVYGGFLRCTVYVVERT